MDGGLYAMVIHVIQINQLSRITTVLKINNALLKYIIKYIPLLTKLYTLFEHFIRQVTG